MSTNASTRTHPNLGMVIAHWHQNGYLAKYLRKFIQAAHQNLTGKIVFVSTNLTPDARDWLMQFTHVVIRENFGYDFWSYKLGLEYLNARHEMDQILYVNSSFIILDPQPLLNALPQSSEIPGFFGLTKSFQHIEHAQSYFLLFNGKDHTQSTHVAEWWNRMIPVSDRNEVIQKYELGLSKYIAEMGIPIRSLFTPTVYDQAIASVRHITQYGLPAAPVREGRYLTVDLAIGNLTNPTHSMWDGLIREFGIVKFDFLRNSIFASQVLPFIARSARWRETDALSVIDDALNGA